MWRIRTASLKEESLNGMERKQIWQRKSAFPKIPCQRN